MANILKRAAAWLTNKPTTPASHQVRRFQAARIDRLSADWLVTTQSINQELRSDLDRLRARGRDLANNNDYARRFVRMCQDNIVGPDGIRLQSRVTEANGTPDRLAAKAIEAGWQQWQPLADATGKQHFVDMLRTAVGGLPSDGEFLLREVRGSAAGNPYGYALQPIDVDRIDTTYHGRAANGNQVVMGVEIDAYRRPQALHLFLAHPNDGEHSSRQRERVPVANLIHAYRTDRPEQLRGIPWMAPGMLSLHHLGNFKLSALLAAEHGANHYGFFSSPDGAPPIGVEDATTGEAISTTQPGTFDTLPAGVTFQAYDSKYPEQNFGPFVKTTLQRIASGWGVAYHALANDLEGVSFSSIRSGTLAERDRWMADQQWLIQAVLERIFTNWLQSALLMGAITMPNGSALPAAKAAKFARHEWQPRRWDWVDPKADTEANILKVRAGLMAPQDLAASMGYDFDDVLSNIKAAQDLASSYGITLPAYDSLPGAVGGGQATAQDNAQPVAPASKQLDDVQAQVRELHKMAREFAVAAVAQYRTQATQQPQPINVQLQTQQIDTAVARAMDTIAAQAAEQIRQVADAMPINITTPAPVVNVTTPAPVVNVTAPAVSFEATVPQAQVVVAHPARAVQTVERDANDEILRTVTTYEGA
jgi:lambda family phage portal protein